MTTPFLLLDSSPAQWLACLDRALGACPPERGRKLYPLRLKYGHGPRCWPEYVFEGCLNHERDVIFLQGFPDIEEGRPHSRANL